KAWFEQSIALDPTRRSAQQSLARLDTSRTELPIALSRPILVKTRPATTRSERGWAGDHSSPRFEDVAKSAGINFTYQSHAKGDMFLGDAMGGGVGFIDFDGDGWQDLYFVGGCKMPYDTNAPPAPNRLYRNK